MGKIRTATLSSFVGVTNIGLSTFGAIYVRMYFIKQLGTEYLGILAIFSSILGVLLALDCGIAGSMFYKIYVPIAEDDREKIISTFNTIKLVYGARAILIFMVGAVFIFFLPTFCKSSTISMECIYEGYIIYLIMTSLSYYIILYSFFLEAVQKRYLVSLIAIIAYFISTILQLIFLIYTPTFAIYLVIFIGQQLIVYYICMVIVYNQYPYLRYTKKRKSIDFKELKQYLKLAFHTLGTVVAAYTDSFLITMFTGVNTLGLYDNYKVISSKVSSVLDQITSSLKDPIRLLIAEGDMCKAEKNLLNVNYFLFFIAGMCSLLYLTTISLFIKMWLGEQYVMGLGIALVSAYVFFLKTLNYITVDVYYQAECYKNDRKTPIIEIIVNMCVSFLLGWKLGIIGVLIGTVFYYIVQEYLRARRVYTNLFLKSANTYLYMYFLYCIIFSVVMSIVFYFEQNNVFECTPIISVIIRILIESAIFVLINYILFKDNDSFLYLRNLLYGYVCKMSAKNR